MPRNYKWTSTSSECEITIQLPPDTIAKDVVIVHAPPQLAVTLKSSRAVLLEGKLLGKTSQDEDDDVSWSIVRDTKGDTLVLELELAATWPAQTGLLEGEEPDEEDKAALARKCFAEAQTMSAAAAQAARAPDAASQQQAVALVQGAVEKLKQAGELGSPDACLRVAESYYRSAAAYVDEELGAAREGEDAQNFVNMTAQAKTWFEKAAQQGRVGKALVGLGQIHCDAHRATGEQKSFDLAMAHWEKAAEFREHVGMHRLLKLMAPTGDYAGMRMRVEKWCVSVPQAAPLLEALAADDLIGLVTLGVQIANALAGEQGVIDANEVVALLPGRAGRKAARALRTASGDGPAAQDEGEARNLMAAGVGLAVLVVGAAAYIRWERNYI